MNPEMLRILVALDGSTRGETILASLMPLARARPVGLVLFRVAEPRESSEAARAYLAEVTAALTRQGLDAVALVGQGSPAAEILKTAQTTGVDLIALATHGRTGVPRVLCGSVTEEVLRRAPIPLLVDRAGTRKAEWKRIVVALDGSQEAETILPDACRLARLLGAHVDLVQSVFVSAMPLAGMPEMPLCMPPHDPMPYLRRTRERLAETFGVQAETAALGGTPAAEIVRWATDRNADLVCLTTHGRTGLARAFLGSVAEQVLRTAPCAVMVRRLAGVGVAETVGHPVK